MGGGGLGRCQKLRTLPVQLRVLLLEPGESASWSWRSRLHPILSLSESRVQGWELPTQDTQLYVEKHTTTHDIISRGGVLQVLAYTEEWKSTDRLTSENWFAEEIG